MKSNIDKILPTKKQVEDLMTDENKIDKYLAIMEWLRNRYSLPDGGIILMKGEIQSTFSKLESLFFCRYITNKLSSIDKLKLTRGIKNEVIEKTAEKIIKSGDLSYPLNRKFEAFCKEYDLEYNFESKHGYYGNWLTNQAFVIYKYSDMETRK